MGVMEVKEDGGWRSRAGAVLGFFSLFVTFIPMLRHFMGIKVPTVEFTYFKYGLLLGAIGAVVSLAMGKGWGGWRLWGFTLSAFGSAAAVGFIILSSATDFFVNQ
jgi:hypothetical protein